MDLMAEIFVIEVKTNLNGLIFKSRT